MNESESSTDKALNAPVTPLADDVHQGANVPDSAVPRPESSEAIGAEGIRNLINAGKAILGQVSESGLLPMAGRSEQSSTSCVEDAGDQVGVERLEEIMDHMRALKRRIREVEESQQLVVAGLAQLQKTLPQSVTAIARELDTLRRDILGDRRHTSHTDLFNELIPMIDRLQTMLGNLDENEDSRTIAQLKGVLTTLVSCLRRLGCEVYHAVPGCPFDPARMQCAGYCSEGEPGIVLEAIQSGYACGEFVLRPALVRIADPHPIVTQDTGNDFDE